MEELTKKFILVEMNEVKETSLDKHIIGTEALATCTGLLIYSKKYNKAIVAHLSSDWSKIINELFNLLVSNLECDDFKYKIIPGYYGINKEIETKIIELMKKFSYKKLDIDSGIRLDEETKSYEFAFDSKSGKFVTNQVYFGKDYYEINKVRV